MIPRHIKYLGFKHAEGLSVVFQASVKHFKVGFPVKVLSLGWDFKQMLQHQMMVSR